MAENTRQSKARNNGQEKWWTDEVVQSEQRERLDRLQNGETMWQEVCALVEASVSRMSANQSTMQKKRRKKENRTQARKLEKKA